MNKIRQVKIEVTESKYNKNYFVSIRIPTVQDYDNNPELDIIHYKNHLFIQFACETKPVISHKGDVESRPLEKVMFWGSEFSDFMRARNGDT